MTISVRSKSDILGEAGEVGSSDNFVSYKCANVTKRLWIITNENTEMAKIYTHL